MSYHTDHVRLQTCHTDMPMEVFKTFAKAHVGALEQLQTAAEELPMLLASALRLTPTRGLQYGTFAWT